MCQFTSSSNLQVALVVILAVEYHLGAQLIFELKKLQELKQLQQLLDENVINKEEFDEKKALVLNSLCKLVH